MAAANLMRPRHGASRSRGQLGHTMRWQRCGWCRPSAITGRCRGCRGCRVRFRDGRKVEKCADAGFIATILVLISKKL